MSGYPPTSGSYQMGSYQTQQQYGSYPGNSPNQYPPPQGQYPPPQGQYPPFQGQYPPPQGQYPPPQAQYPAPQGYPPPQGPYPPPQGQYPPSQGQYPPPQGQYPPPQGQFPQPGSAEKPVTSQVGFTVASDGPDPNDLPTEEGPDATPTAPPLGSMAQLPGYEGLTFSGGSAPPPPHPQAGAVSADHGKVQVQHHVLTEGEVREHLAQYVSEHCCYGKGPINDMKISAIEPVPALRYTLDTMTEKRVTCWQFVPWRGEPIPPATGPPPEPWDIQVNLNPDQLFQKLDSKLEVPNTQSVRMCHQCNGNGDVRCTRCHGRGYRRCTSCHGRGSSGNRRCTWCHGRGSRVCNVCHRNGMIVCPTCEGARNIKCYVELTVHWQAHKDIKVVERTDLPDHLINNAGGEVVFSDEQPRVNPVLGFPEPEISRGSQELTEKHATAWPTERIYRQRQVIHSVPVNRIRYSYSDKHDKFFIYGSENKVHFPEYPSKCCCVIQ